MPWRVGRDLRHLYHAAHSILERSRVPLHSICLIAKPIHSSRVPCRPAVALQLNHSHAARTSNSQGDPDAFGIGDGDPESILLSFRGCPPPPNILAILDHIFNTRSASVPTLAELKSLHPTAELVTYLRLPHCAPALVHYLLDAREHRRALWVLRIAREGGYTFSPKFYGQVAEKLADMKKWRLVLALTHDARQHLGYTTTGLLNWRLHALMECQRYSSAEEVLELFAKEQVRPSRLTYHILISMHLRNHNLPGALAVVRSMESAGFRVSARTWAVILLSHRSLGLTPTAKAQALGALQAADGHAATAILNGLVQLLLDAHDLVGAVDVLSLVAPLPVGPRSDPGADTTLGGDASITTDHTQSASSPPFRRPIPVNISTYNILLNYLARQGDLEGSMEALRQMHAADVLPNGGTANALVRLYFTTAFPNDALHIVADALRDAPAASALLPRLGYSSATPAEHPVYPHTASPTIDLFNALVWGILHTRHLNGLRTALRMMRLSKVDADANTLAILTSYLHHDECARPREMIRAIRTMMAAGIAPTSRHLHVLMAAVLREERLVTRPRGWAVDSTTGDTVGSPPGDEAQLDVDKYSLPTAGVPFPRRLRYRSLMRPIVQSLADRGVRSDRVTFAMRIKHDAVVKQDLEMALASFRKMVDGGMRPNEYHYGALMEGFAAAGDMQGAADLMREAADAGVTVDVKTHTILIAGYARLAQPAQALAAFRAMVADGIRPDVPAIDALVSAFFRAKAYRKARRALLQLWPQIGPLSDDLVRAPLRRLIVAFRALHEPNKKRPPGRLSSAKQRMLRWKIRDILQGWKAGLDCTQEKREEKASDSEAAQRRVRPVPSTCTPRDTRAKRR
ncbi:hypothetical protein C8Q77DRAFT_1214196 [Trametes polyzona]|nr:hypothetical protein C8Q77DRAFT_1214196 [Trametes polyzona]